MLMDMLSSLRKLGVALLLDDFDMGSAPQSLAFIFLSARPGSHPGDTSQKKACARAD
jgi:hypothetical protein